MHRNTMTRSWGPLSCHSSADITSCFSMIMHHGPMSQGSVHNSWRLKMSQFFHGLHTHQTCYRLSMFGMLWINVYDSVFQFPPISSNFAQPLKRSGTIFHRPQPAWSTLCGRDVSRFMRQIVVTQDTDRFSDPRPYLFLKVSVTNRCIFVFTVTFPYMNCNSVKSLKLLYVGCIVLFSVNELNIIQKMGSYLFKFSF